MGRAGGDNGNFKEQIEKLEKQIEKLEKEKEEIRKEKDLYKEEKIRLQGALDLQKAELENAKKQGSKGCVIQ